MTETALARDTALAHVDVETGEILPTHPEAGITLFGTSDPEAIATDAAAKAVVLKRVVDKAGLIKTLGRDKKTGKPRLFMTLEGWTFLGSMFGVFASVEWSRPMLDEAGNLFGYEARAEARTLEGLVVGAAEAMCTIHEQNWRGRDQFAVRSMAQTRAVSKALRMPLSFVTVLAGYEATPADEMPAEDSSEWGAQSSPSGVRPSSGDRSVSTSDGEREQGQDAERSDGEAERSGPVPAPTTLDENEPATDAQWERLLALKDVGGSQVKAVNRINRCNGTSYMKDTAAQATVAELARAILGEKRSA